MDAWVIILFLYGRQDFESRIYYIVNGSWKSRIMHQPTKGLMQLFAISLRSRVINTWQNSFNLRRALVFLCSLENILLLLLFIFWLFMVRNVWNSQFQSWFFFRVSVWISIHTKIQRRTILEIFSGVTKMFLFPKQMIYFSYSWLERS